MHRQTAPINVVLATDEEPGEDDGEVDDAEIFVELKTARFLRLTGLPLPTPLEEIER